MAAKVFNIETQDNFIKGVDRTIRIAIDDATGAAVDASGFALAWYLKSSSSSTTKLLTKTTGAGDITFGNYLGTSDRALITIADTDTEGLTAGLLWHQLLRTDAGLEEEIAIGTVQLLDHGVS